MEKIGTTLVPVFLYNLYFGKHAEELAECGQLFLFFYVLVDLFMLRFICISCVAAYTLFPIPIAVLYFHLSERLTSVFVHPEDGIVFSVFLLKP